MPLWRTFHSDDENHYIAVCSLFLKKFCMSFYHKTSLIIFTNKLSFQQTATFCVFVSLEYKRSKNAICHLLLVCECTVGLHGWLPFLYLELVTLNKLHFTNYNYISNQHKLSYLNSKCSSVLTCSWCMYEGNARTLDKPYCTTNDLCPNGKLTHGFDEGKGIKGRT